MMTTGASGPQIRYSPFLAVELLSLLATRDITRPATAERLAQAIGRSISFTETFLVRLRREGFVGARKGPGGGYFLGRRADQILISDVFEALDAPGSQGGWSFSAPKITQAQVDQLHGTQLLWESLRSCIFMFLSGVSIADVAPQEGGVGRLPEAWIEWSHAGASARSTADPDAADDISADDASDGDFEYQH